MADARGGYRRPTNPAPASGPGKLSRRTDGRQPKMQLPDAAYGEQATFQADQGGAPMDRAPGALNPPTPTSAGPSPADLSSVVPFGAPTERPGEPVTSGAASGPGPGPASLGLSAPGQPGDPGTDYLYRLLPMFELAANQPTSSLEFRQFVRRLRGLS